MQIPTHERARAFHRKNSAGTAHVVGIRNLRVLMTEHEGGRWFAQGLEIDYGVEGRDLDDVRRAFEYGLAATIVVNLREFGHIRNLLVPAPKEVQRRAGTAVKRYSQISAHFFPFEIEFVQAA